MPRLDCSLDGITHVGRQHFVERELGEDSRERFVRQSAREMLRVLYWAFFKVETRL